MGIEDLFEAEKQRWKEHCERVDHSSNPQDYLNCEAYSNKLRVGYRCYVSSF